MSFIFWRRFGEVYPGAETASTDPRTDFIWSYHDQQGVKRGKKRRYHCRQWPTKSIRKSKDHRTHSAFCDFPSRLSVPPPSHSPHSGSCVLAHWHWPNFRVFPTASSEAGETCLIWAPYVACLTFDIQDKLPLHSPLPHHPSTSLCLFRSQNISEGQI